MEAVCDNMVNGMYSSSTTPQVAYHVYWCQSTAMGAAIARMAIIACNVGNRKYLKKSREEQQNSHLKWKTWLLILGLAWLLILGLALHAVSCMYTP